MCEHEDLWKGLEGLCASVVLVLRGRAQQTPRGHWPDNIKRVMNSRFNEKHKMEK